MNALNMSREQNFVTFDVLDYFEIELRFSGHLSYGSCWTATGTRATQQATDAMSVAQGEQDGVAP